MNYPIWETTFFGGGTWIALIAVLHVYIAHLAVGGGLFIWATELKAWRERDATLHQYLRRHVWFFLYLSMVFGGVSGVGIWFVIALVHPSATSVLIHNFVFGWAIEWVFFLGEIVALLLYTYRFDHLEETNRKRLAFFYAVFAWLSLFIINGILSFMLTPGKWLSTGNFWDGFLNPTFFPSLFFRTFMACVIAGVFGYVTALRINEKADRERMLRYCTKWLIYPLPGAVLAGLWYFYALPSSIRVTAFSLNQQSHVFVFALLTATVAIFLLGIVMSLKSGQFAQRIVACVIVLVGLGWIGGFEYTREVARKPYVIGNYLYANAISPSSVAQLNEKGVLATARWVAVRDSDGKSAPAAGRELFNLQCLSCHTLGGIRNDLLKKTAHFTYTGLLSQLTGQGRALDYMPPVAGTIKERQALAAYLAGLYGKPIIAQPEPFTIKPTSVPTIVRDASKDGYLLLVWNDLGMHCMSDGDQYFVFLPPANTLEAQLIKRGPTPEIVGNDKYEVVYKANQGFENPSAHSRFWEFSESNFGAKLPKNVGLAGFGLTGAFKYEEERKTYFAKWIPVVPYPDGGGVDPYPTFTVEAKEKQSGKVVATAPVVAGVSTELGCRNCHGGQWKVEGTSGLSNETAGNILAVHDRLNKTDLSVMAAAGKPQLCQSCHPDPAVGAKGKPGVLNLSAAMHGWHANYMHAKGAAACSMCHPTDPKGRTRCSRSIHASSGLTCVNCHGALSDHALALLKGQAELSPAKRLMKNLVPAAVASKAEINPRNPWINEPDCLNCHKGFNRPEPGASGYNKWTRGSGGLYRVRGDDTGLRCTACHGTPHGEYPAINPYSPMKDNVVPLQYTGKPYPMGSEMACETCHTKKMKDPIHHENMYRSFRSKKVWEEALEKTHQTPSAPAVMINTASAAAKGP
jgi:cytochrome bd-type quinol oxidase subunit 1